MKTTPTRPGAPSRAPGARAAQPSRPASSSARKANARATQEFVRGVVQEMRRVTWPTREEWIAATILTLALVIGVGLFTYVVDVTLGWIFGLLTGGTR
jgi:preprotein translocase subunit SecE